ncbi:MAG TPA: sigma-70 family RNA polymerase sigma factor [Thermoguttaceae bacterium]|nr:sigma-70 family RNA polymerase sigma factor [Thermoguttaceae bacterium]
MTEPSLDHRRQWVLSALGQYEQRLVRYAVRLLGDEASARDAVQHAFVRLCEQPSESLNGRLGPWLFAVCRHRAIDLLRARGRTETLDATDAALPAGGEPDPAEAAELDELYAGLRDRVGRLPAAQGEAVNLWADGFSYAEMARILDTNEGNVRVLVHRGLARLRNDPIARRLFNR